VQFCYEVTPPVLGIRVELNGRALEIEKAASGEGVKLHTQYTIPLPHQNRFPIATSIRSRIYVHFPPDFDDLISSVPVPVPVHEI